MNQVDIFSDFEPFQIFRKYALKMMRSCQMPKEHDQKNLITMWSVVHGLAAMANMRNFQYDGDWGRLTANVLDTRINIF